MIVIGIDPGTAQSGFVRYETDGPVLDYGAPYPRRRGTVLEHGVTSNEDLLGRCWRAAGRESDPSADVLVLEMLHRFGPAGPTDFRTCWWAGRFAEAWGPDGYHELTRHDVKIHLCHTAKSDDAAVRAALVERWGGKAVAIGAVGRGKAKTPPGPLHGVASHSWQALAVAVTWADRREAALVREQQQSVAPAQNGAP